MGCLLSKMWTKSVRKVCIREALWYYNEEYCRNRTLTLTTGSPAPNFSAILSATLAVVTKGHTINLYQLEDVQNLALKPDSCQDLAFVPNHVVFSTQSLGAISFLNKASLIACSPSSRTLSMWVGVWVSAHWYWTWILLAVTASPAWQQMLVDRCCFIFPFLPLNARLLHVYARNYGKPLSILIKYKTIHTPKIESIKMFSKCFFKMLSIFGVSIVLYFTCICRWSVKLQALRTPVIVCDRGGTEKGWVNTILKWVNETQNYSRVG